MVGDCGKLYGQQVTAGLLYQLRLVYVSSPALPGFPIFKKKSRLFFTNVIFFGNFILHGMCNLSFPIRG